MAKAAIRYNGASKIIEANAEKGTVLLAGKEITVTDSPVTGTIYGTLLNFKSELRALGSKMNEAPYLHPPKAPVLYIKPSNTIIGTHSPIPFPKESSVLQTGAGLGIVIGKKTAKIKEEEAYHYIAGYTIVNDISIPHDSFYRPAVKEKVRDGFCPIGPWVIERDAVPNPDSLSINVYVNEELKQTSSTTDLIRPISVLLTEVSQFMTLYEGDVLIAGTKENPPLLKEHDTVKIEIEHVGVLENTLVPEHEVVKELS
ncbi:fumarylacetoacetate hydrolase family protein [Metabacillus sp. RGM 3146]|uniref:fumarylacetoacetate hydrolase family protein n=1 Tax=Metabacillus sp. RGM 3146 TaxID=3401092 RepID=UPI003B9D34C6